MRPGITAIPAEPSLPFSLVWRPIWLWPFYDRPETSAHVSQSALEHVSASVAEEIDQAREPQAATVLKIPWKRFLTNPTQLANYRFPFFSDDFPPLSEEILSNYL